MLTDHAARRGGQPGELCERLPHGFDQVGLEVAEALAHLRRDAALLHAQQPHRYGLKQQKVARPHLLLVDRYPELGQAGV